MLGHDFDAGDLGGAHPLHDARGERAVVRADVEQPPAATRRQRRQDGAAVGFLGGAEDPAQVAGGLGRPAARRQGRGQGMGLEDVGHPCARLTASRKAASDGLATPAFVTSPVCRPQKSERPG